MMKLTKGICYEYVPLKQFNTWRIGGCARYLYIPESIEGLSQFLQNLPAKLPIICLGLGSNVLLADGVINAIFILFRNTFKSYEVIKDEQIVTLGAGIACPTVARKTAKLGFDNLNFLAGIPGTIGGALRMNAGAFGGEVWSEVVDVTLMNKKGELIYKKQQDIKFGYRTLEYSKDEYFVEATLRLVKNTAHLPLVTLLDQRKNLQPIQLASCGSVFKNPKESYAARLIDDCGLKNYHIGGAVISSKHANFIINQDQASFQNVLDLISHVQVEVKRKFNIKLEPEVKIIGVDGEYQCVR